MTFNFQGHSRANLMLPLDCQLDFLWVFYSNMSLYSSFTCGRRLKKCLLSLFIWPKFRIPTPALNKTTTGTTIHTHTPLRHTHIGLSIYSESEQYRWIPYMLLPINVHSVPYTLSNPFWDIRVWHIGLSDFGLDLSRVLVSNRMTRMQFLCMNSYQCLTVTCDLTRGIRPHNLSDLSQQLKVKSDSAIGLAT